MRSARPGPARPASARADAIKYLVKQLGRLEATAREVRPRADPLIKQPANQLVKRLVKQLVE